MRDFLLRIAAIALAIGTSQAAATPGAQGSRDDSPLLGPDVTLTGYVVPMDETILLFPSLRAANAFDVAVCLNIGADAALFSRLSHAAGHPIRLHAVDLGTHYAQLTHSEFAFWRLRGRRIQIYCIRDNVYWARDFQRVR
jgi:hypothetical protein